MNEMQHRSRWEKYYVYIWGCLAIVMTSWMGIAIVARERNRPFSRLAVWVMGFATLPAAFAAGWLVPAHPSLPLLPHALLALFLGWILLCLAFALLSMFFIYIGAVIWGWDISSPHY